MWILSIKKFRKFPSCNGSVTEAQKVLSSTLDSGSDRLTIEVSAL